MSVRPKYSRDDILNLVPKDGSWLWYAVYGLPTWYRLAVHPEDLILKNATVLLISRPGDSFIPKNVALMTLRPQAEELKKQHNLKQVFVNLSDEEKMEKLGA